MMPQRSFFTFKLEPLAFPGHLGTFGIVDATFLGKFFSCLLQPFM